MNNIKEENKQEPHFINTHMLLGAGINPMAAFEMIHSLSQPNSLLLLVNPTKAIVRAISAPTDNIPYLTLPSIDINALTKALNRAILKKDNILIINTEQKYSHNLDRLIKNFYSNSDINKQHQTTAVFFDELNVVCEDCSFTHEELLNIKNSSLIKATKRIDLFNKYLPLLNNSIFPSNKLRISKDHFIDAQSCGKHKKTILISSHIVIDGTSNNHHNCIPLLVKTLQEADKGHIDHLHLTINQND